MLCVCAQVCANVHTHVAVEASGSIRGLPHLLFTFLVGQSFHLTLDIT